MIVGSNPPTSYPVFLVNPGSDPPLILSFLFFLSILFQTLLLSQKQIYRITLNHGIIKLL